MRKLFLMLVVLAIVVPAISAYTELFYEPFTAVDGTDISLWNGWTCRVADDTLTPTDCPEIYSNQAKLVKCAHGTTQDIDCMHNFSAQDIFVQNVTVRFQLNNSQSVNNYIFGSCNQTYSGAEMCGQDIPKNAGTYIAVWYSSGLFDMYINGVVTHFGTISRDSGALVEFAWKTNGGSDSNFSVIVDGTAYYNVITAYGRNRSTVFVSSYGYNEYYDNINVTVSSYSASNETAIFPLLGVSAFNDSYPNVDTHSFKEGVRFYGKANFTFNGSILSSATCNFSYKNVSEMGFYNSTKEMYLNKTGYVDYAHGITNLTAFCKQGSYNASGSWYIDIENIAPSVSINSVVDADGNTYTMSEGVFLEFIDGDYTWNISIDDDDLDYYLITLRNSTDVIQSGTSIPFSNDGLLFVDFHQNPFNISVFANDSAGDSSYQSFTFNINDTSMPVCTTLVDASIENSSVYKVNVSCSDEYLFSYNLSCDNTNIFSKYQADIFNTTYIYYNSSLIDLGEGQINCWYEYCDGHTAELISDIDINVPKGNLINNEIIIDNKIIKVDSAVAKWTYEKKSDRITFCSEFTEPIYEASYEIPSGCYPALNSKWKGHLVCPETRTWIDYNNKNYDVQITNKVKVIFNKQTNKACFDSVGKFNCVTGTFTVNITLPLTNSSSRLKIGYCPDTTASVLILFIFLIISLVLLVLGFIIRSGFLLFFSGIFLIALS